ncbi:MAG: RNA 2',3'-cyclic phosphodiesterase [Anaerolineae bacterium]|nr:RNA 2',3'-cyclic phosphodiesterase [Anaerolineae bacterium]
MSLVRAFIALELPQTILDKIERLQERLKQDVPSGLVRWVRPDGIHLTLYFLGDVPEEQISDIAGAMCQACTPYARFVISIAGLGCFPNASHPRVVWVGVDEQTGTLARLQQAVERALVPLGFPPETRSFHPHLTLGRVKGGDRERVQVLGETITRARVDIGRIEMASVSLMRSELLPGGAVYTQLAEAALGGGQAL